MKLQSINQSINQSASLNSPKNKNVGFEGRMVQVPPGVYIDSAAIQTVHMGQKGSSFGIFINYLEDVYIEGLQTPRKTVKKAFMSLFQKENVDYLKLGKMERKVADKVSIAKTTSGKSIDPYVGLYNE